MKEYYKKEVEIMPATEAGRITAEARAAAAKEQEIRTARQIEEAVLSLRNALAVKIKSLSGMGATKASYSSSCKEAADRIRTELIMKGYACDIKENTVDVSEPSEEDTETRYIISAEWKLRP